MDVKEIFNEELFLVEGVFKDNKDQRFLKVKCLTDHLSHDVEKGATGIKLKGGLAHYYFEAENSIQALPILLEISNVRYADSTGLSAILVGNRLDREIGKGNFTLCGLSGAVDTLVTISQLDCILNIAQESDFTKVAEDLTV